MPHILLPQIDTAYDLISYDAAGVERADDPDGPMSRRVLKFVEREPVSDLFLMCFGWEEDISSAKARYDAWIRLMAEVSRDESGAGPRPGPRPMFVALHWPSRPWSDEEFGPAGDAAAPSKAPCVETYAKRIADTPSARRALHTIFRAAGRRQPLASLPRDVRSAYCVLDWQSGLGSAREGAAPGDDREPFDPDQRFQAARQSAPADAGATVVTDTLLSPLRQLSFWKAMGRSRQIGESAAHQLLRALLRARTAMRVHLVGHSVGCIVVSAALAGPPDGPDIPRPVQSLMLVQGNLSLWSYCSDIPYRRGTQGFFRPVVTAGLVAGPVVATHSRFDPTPGRWYPLAAGAVRQVEFATGELPRYGGVGTFGVRGPGLDVVDLEILPPGQPYPFRASGFYNLDSSRVICKGSGASGAHADIVHAEVAHAVWSAALA
jgi:hypothetical protein